MKLILTPKDKKALLAAAILVTIIAGGMKIVLHFAPIAYVNTN